MYVQFSDATQTTIIAWFGSAQDPDVYPNLGEVDEDDARYIAFLEMTDPTPSVVEVNTDRRNQLLAAASLAIAPLQDALDLGIIEPQEQSLLTAWKQFRVAVNRVVLTLPNPVWPTPPQGGYGAVGTPPVEDA